MNYLNVGITHHRSGSAGEMLPASTERTKPSKEERECRPERLEEEPEGRGHI